MFMHAGFGIKNMLSIMFKTNLASAKSNFNGSVLTVITISVMHWVTCTRTIRAYIICTLEFGEVEQKWKGRSD